jgi:hypothetical protein
MSLVSTASLQKKQAENPDHGLLRTDFTEYNNGYMERSPGQRKRCRAYPHSQNPCRSVFNNPWQKLAGLNHNFGIETHYRDAGVVKARPRKFLPPLHAPMPDRTTISAPSYAILLSPRKSKLLLTSKLLKLQSKLLLLIRMAFQLIPSGSFRMRSRGYLSYEGPMHQVCITKPFWMAQFALWTRSEGVKHNKSFPLSA